jgi:Sec-independent protein translocase protein TatA
MLPHLGEVIMISVIVLLIFGLGRLPSISEFVANGFQTPPKDPPKNA